MKKLPTKDEIEVRLSSTSPDWWAALPIGMKNAYTCESCAKRIITLDVDRGATPMIITCAKCGHQMKSAWYRVSQDLPHTHVWYRPEGKELKVLLKNPATRSHYLSGGLSIKEVEQ